MPTMTINCTGPGDARCPCAAHILARRDAAERRRRARHVPRWIVAWQVNVARRASGAAATEMALLELHGERLAVHGDVWGGADVVVASPRERPDALRVVPVPRRYRALREALAVRVPGDA